MNRKEALRILGLDEDASADDVKAAYRECAQILHPDRFASNKRLQERATEQFKTLQEAYEYLTSGKGRRSGSRASAGGSRAEGSHTHSRESELEARLAGIAAARVQLVAQRDATLDERRNGLIMVGLGGIVALFASRRPFGLFGVVAAIATAAAVWGIVQVISAVSRLSSLDEHLEKLTAEQKKLTRELEDLE